MKRPIIDNSFIDVRSKQNTSCNWTGSADFGRLVPFHIEELIPSEKVVSCRPRIEMQMLPLASPTFGKMDLYVHYFWVPERLLWSASKDYHSGTGPLKNDVPPFITEGQLAQLYNNISDAGLKRGIYKHWTSLGLPAFFADSSFVPTTSSPRNKQHLTLLKFRAYQQIWWDFYRDPEVLRDDTKGTYISTSSGQYDGSLIIHQNTLVPHSRSLKDNWVANLFASGGSTPLGIEFGAADLDNELAVSVGSTSQNIRKIEALTRLSERLSLAGKRQIEALFARYGVKPTYDKMMMCQYLGGSKSTVLVSDITSQADTSVAGSSSVSPTGLPLGAKAGQGYCAMADLNIDFTAPEHGFLVGIFSVMPHVHFVQGLDKSWFRNSRDDWFNKQLEHVGQVAVARKEVAFGPTYATADDEKTFAFTQPYYEYKQGRDIIAGDMLKYLYTLDQSNEEQYLQSMSMYVKYASDREFNVSNLLIDRYDFNKVFFYLGGSLFTDSDDHFHLSIDKFVEKDSPADGYAVPTLDTTQDPHKKESPVGQDVVL